MPSKKAISSKSALPYKSANKDRRRDYHIKQKKARDSIQREKRFARKKLEDKNPELKEARLRDNIPITIDSKRKWDDEGEEGDEGLLGLSVDLGALAKRRKLEELEQLEPNDEFANDDSAAADKVEEERPAEDILGKEGDEESDMDSMLGDSDEEEDEDVFKKPSIPMRPRASSTAASIASTTRSDLTPEAIASRFPTLFAEPSSDPKVLITTSINSTLHKEAETLEELIPNSAYVRRSGHRFDHKYSLKEIAKFASNRNFTTSQLWS